VSRRVALLLVLAFVASLNCGRAGGTQEDPLDREAEEALVAYLRVDTTNPPGNETAGATMLRDLLVKDGIAARLIGDDPKRQAVYARLESTAPKKEKALVLLSHIDVVPANAASWTHPPFAGVREGGYIWGRGALDCKSLAIAELMSLVDLRRRGAKLRRDLILLAVPDEELGGLQGAKKILERFPELFADAGFVLNEGGSNETAMEQVLFWGIEIDQKVPLWLRVTTEASGGHGAAPADGGGATAKLIRALAAVDAIATPYRLTPSVARTSAIAARERKDGRGQRFKLLREPLDIAAIERELPPGYRAMLRDTIAITRLAAGNAVNSVPSRAIGEIDIRLLPGSTPDAMLARVKQAVGTNGTVEVLLAGEPVPGSSETTELYRVLARAMREASPGSAVAPMVGAGTTDSRFFRARGITAYGIAPFKVNYYDADTVHSDDERIRSRFFVEGVRLMRRVVSDFCERQKAEGGRQK